MDISYGQTDSTKQPTNQSAFRFLFSFFNQCLALIPHSISIQLRELKSNGTLLPLPARYFRTPPWNGRGFGNRLSFWNLNLLSSILTIPGEPPGLDSGECPPLVRVYELGSSIDLAAGWSLCEVGREGVGVV